MISSLSRHGKILGFVRLPEATGLSDLHLIVNKIKSDLLEGATPQMYNLYISYNLCSNLKSVH